MTNLVAEHLATNYLFVANVATDNGFASKGRLCLSTEPTATLGVQRPKILVAELNQQTVTAFEHPSL